MTPHPNSKLDSWRYDFERVWENAQLERSMRIASCRGYYGYEDGTLAYQERERMVCHRCMTLDHC